MTRMLWSHTKAQNGVPIVSQEVSTPSHLSFQPAEPFLVETTCYPLLKGQSCASCTKLKVKCIWPPGSKHAQQESLEVTWEMTHSQDDMAWALDQLAAAMEKSQIALEARDEESDDMLEG